MTTLSASTVPVDLLRPVAGVSTAAAASGTDSAKRAAIQKTAQDFEASFLSKAIDLMFEGVSVAPPFGGGQGEASFRSFLNDAMAKQIEKKGGIGVAASVQREMLRMQGLAAEPAR